MAEVTKSIELRAPPQAVWDALTNGKKLGAWLDCDAAWKLHHGTLHPGDTFRLAWDEEWVATGEAVSVEAGQRLVTTWEWEGDDEETEVEYRLEKTANGTRLTLVHRGFEDDHTAEEHGDNWAAYLNKLPKVLGTR